MGAFLLKRTLHIFLILFLFVSLTYLLFQVTPGSVVDKFLGNPKMTPEIIAKIRAQFGLDDPWYVQYFRYLKNVFTGQLGISYSQYPTPVWDILKDRIPRTLVLFLSSRVISFYLGFILGKIIAWKRGSLIDTSTTAVGITFWTMYYPLLAIVNIWLFGFLLGWFPINGFTNPLLWLNAPEGLTVNRIFAYMILTGFIFLILWMFAWLIAKKPELSGKAKKRIIYISPLTVVIIAVLIWGFSGYGKYAWDIIYHMILPIFTLALISFGGTMLLTRDSMMETIQEDYVMAARAKGLPPKLIRDKYAARTALLPVVTSLTLSLGFVLSGGVITESLFSWPGLGRTLLDAALMQDVPLAIGAFAFTGVFVLIAHLVVDILYAVLDPRISIETI